MEYGFPSHGGRPRRHDTFGDQECRCLTSVSDHGASCKRNGISLVTKPVSPRVYAKSILLNCQHVVFFKNVRDNRQIITFGSKVFTRRLLWLHFDRFDQSLSGIRKPPPANKCVSGRGGYGCLSTPINTLHSFCCLLFRHVTKDLTPRAFFLDFFMKTAACEEMC